MDKLYTMNDESCVVIIFSGKNTLKHTFDQAMQQSENFKVVLCIYDDFVPFPELYIKSKVLIVNHSFDLNGKFYLDKEKMIEELPMIAISHLENN